MERVILQIEHFVPDKSSPVPLHLQLSKMLLRQLRNVPTSGDCRLPSERSVVAEFNIDRTTVHRAYRDLLDRGLVYRNPDKSLSVKKSARKKLHGPYPMIGVIIPERFSSFIAGEFGERRMPYINGIIDRAEERGISLVMLQMPAPDSPDADVRRFIRERCEVLSGLIHLGNRAITDDKVLRGILANKNIPQAFISGWSELKHIGTVAVDFESQIRKFAGILAGSGCGRVVIADFKVMKNETADFHYFAIERMGIVRRSLADCGINVETQDILQLSPVEKETCLLEEFRHWIDNSIDHLPDLIWCVNNQVAKRLISELRRKNIRVPEDVSVIGFDGSPARLDSGEMITSIGSPSYDWGVLAIDTVMEYAENGITENNRIKRLPGSFIQGETVR